MQKVYRLGVLVILTASVGVSAVFADGKGRLVRATFHSAALEGNLLKDSPNRSVFIYLPPSYDRSRSKRFPVVYLLHGVGDSNIDWTNGTYQGLNIPSSADELITSKKIRETIIVMPDAKNAYQGCFYTNSPISGNWEDFVTKDLVGYVDKHYRTIQRPSGRAVTGHSMGGYGSLKLAMKRPDVFGVVFAISPCCFEWDADISMENPLWERTLSLTSVSAEDEKNFYPKLFLTLAMVWSPNRNRPPFYGDMPFRKTVTGLAIAEPGHSAWSANFLLPMAGQYRTNLRSLKAIGIDYGSREQFAHIARGSRKFGAYLDSEGIGNRILEFDGDHFERVRERIEAHLLPFVTSNLDPAR